MASTSTSAAQEDQQQKESLLLRLPPEILYEIFKRLEINDLDRLKSTCTQLDNTVEKYKVICKDSYLTQQIMNSKSIYDDDEDDDYDDYDYEEDYSGADYDDDDLEHIQNEMLDNLSFGSDYDPELHAVLNGDEGDAAN